MNKRLEKFLIILVLIGQLLAQGVYLPGIDIFPLYLWVLIFLGMMEMICWVRASRGVLSYTYANGIPFTLCLLTVNQVMVYVLNLNIDIQAIGLALFLMIFALACYNSVKSAADLKWYLDAYLIIVCISAIVELGQFLNIEICYTLWDLTHVEDVIKGAIASRRFLGLASDILMFGYQCSAAFAIAVFRTYEKHNVFKKALCMGILVPAIITNNTRSAFISVAIVMVVWFFRNGRSKANKFMKLAVLFFAIAGALFASITMTGFENNRFASMSADAGTMARIPMFFTAFNHAFHYPFGMGNYQVNEDLIVLANSYTHWVVKINAAHNCIGNCVASFGFIGLGLFLSLYRRIYLLHKNTARYLEENNMYFSIFLAIAVLFINSLFHNAYLLNGDFSTVFFIGLFISAAKIYKYRVCMERG